MCSMKNIFTFLIACLALVSCQDDVAFNNPGFQATVNNGLWKATYSKVTQGLSGDALIKGTSTSHVLELNLQNKAVGKYALGTTNQSNMVKYYAIKNPNAFYSTGITSAPVSAITLASGGSGYSTSSLVTTTGGSGTGLKVNITANTNGVVTAVQINIAGEGYKPGDEVTINGGGNNAKFKVQTVTKSGGEVVITENTGKTISGTFKFTAFEAGTSNMVSCREGVFYKLPIN